MPKAKAHRHNRGYEIARFISEGRLFVVPMGNNRILKVVQRSEPRLPPLKKSHRQIREKRMGIPRGCFLNSRWMRIRQTWDIWDEVEVVDPNTDIEAYRLLTAKGIVFIEGVWYIQIYEVVSGLNKLQRQQIHRKASYEQERLRRYTIIRGVERKMAEHALGLANLSNVQRSQLRQLQARIEGRLKNINLIGAQLSFRELFVFVTGQVQINELEALQGSLKLAIKELSKKTRQKYFTAFLESIEKKLEILTTCETWRSIYWAKWWLGKAKEALNPLNFTECQRCLLGASRHIESAITTLRSWDELVSEEEKHLIPGYKAQTAV